MERSLSDSGWRAGLARNRALRAVALPLLRCCDVPITITNPFSGDPFRLRAYTHKGYWFYGRAREAATMARIDSLLRRGDTVLEVGGHIGFLSQYFARKVGPTGQLHVFEPGQANQRYLKQNIQHYMHAAQVDCAVSDVDGKATFFEENLGGFMNSLDPEFADKTGVAALQNRQLKITARQVHTVTLDGYARRLGLYPDFIKIDVEGAEHNVLRGARETLAQAKAVMVEVSTNPHPVQAILASAGFALSDATGAPITRAAQMRGNIFGVKPGFCG
ncbi:MAG: FkbM family methyltransferase [Pseudomonadota bacterium]